MRLLGLWLREGESGVAAVAYREPDTAAAARRRLRPANRKVRTYKLIPHTSSRQTVSALIEAVRSTGDGVLHVTGWEEAFGGDAFEERIYDLNFLRESVVEHPATQVWWMPVAFRDAFMQRAPDTWSVVKLKLFLNDPKEYIELPPRVAELVRTHLKLRPNMPIPKRKALNLTQFSAFHRDLDESDIVYIPRFSNLRSLDLSFNPVTDLTPLSSLTALNVLLLIGTDVGDLRPISKLEKLRICALGMTRVEDISPLRSLRAIKFLSLSDTHVTDISVLPEITSLADLSLANTCVDDFSPLQGLRFLEELDASETSLSDISFVRNMERLSRLNIRDSRVKDVQPLKSVKSLEWLDLSGLGLSYRTIKSLIEALPNCLIEF